jgi:hypothetical protein
MLKKGNKRLFCLCNYCAFQKYIALSLLTLLIAGAFYGGYCEERPNKKKLFPVVVGVALTVSGAAYAVYHNRIAQSKYDAYQKSAFTDNTNELRRDVAEHELHTMVGGAVAGVGFLTLTIAF